MGVGGWGRGSGDAQLTSVLFSHITWSIMNTAVITGIY